MPSSSSQADCRTIWGEGDYDIWTETDDWSLYYAYVRKEITGSDGVLQLGGVLLLASGNSAENALAEIEHMLRYGASQRQSRAGGGRRMPI